MTVCEPTRIQIIKSQPPLLTGPLFVKLETCEKKIIVLQGGGDAAKTVTILQWLAIKAIHKKEQQITVVGIDVPNLKRGAMRAFKRYVAIHPQIAPFIKFFNKTDREYHFENGSIISFVSFEDDSDARGAEHDYVFMNEVNLMSYNLFWELQRKCRQKILVDYNPTYRFFIHAKLIDGGEKQFIGHVQQYIVDHRHNPFLTEQEHANYENISDPERFAVYARGMTGKTTGMIFNFKRIDAIPEGLEFGFGMDIGYTHDKTTIVKVYWRGKDHYYQELLYKSNDEIQDEINSKGLIGADGKPQTVEGYIKLILVANGYTTSTLLWGDHDKNMSNKLRRAGIAYRMARKGPNSVVASISSVKRYNGHFYNSPNLEKELETYTHATAVDILTGNEVTTGEPVDGMEDHCFVGETKIQTSRGEINIKDIIKGDFVNTTKGFKEVLVKWDNGLQQVNKYLLQLGNFTVSLVCTPNHLIKTNEGWKKISKLKSGQTISLSNFLTEKVLSCNQGNIISIMDQQGCTYSFGDFIMEQSQKDGMFTIKTKTHGITPLKTLKLKKVKSIWQSMLKKGLKMTKSGLLNSEQEQKPVLPSGQKQTIAKKLLTKTDLIHNLAKETLEKLIAITAEKELLKTVTLQNSAQAIASNLQDGSRASITRKESVKYAENNLPQIKIQNQQFVVKNVQVLKAGTREVYDLTVNDCHEYYANGVLVHNCIAAVRMFEHSYSMRHVE